MTIHKFYSLDYLRKQAHWCTIKAEEFRQRANRRLMQQIAVITTDYPKLSVTQAKRMAVAADDAERNGYISDNQFYTARANMWSLLLSAEVAYLNNYVIPYNSNFKTGDPEGENE